MKLNDAKIKARRKVGKMSDGDGLFILVQPNGAKWWRFAYSYAGKRKTLSFGIYPDVTLAQAREKRAEARAQVADGRDPSFERKRATKQQRQAVADTFEAVAGEWLERQQASVAPDTDTRNRTVLRLYLTPVIGRYPIGQIEPPDLLMAFQAIEKKGRHDTAHRVKQLCGQIFRYAIVTGRAKRDPTADLRGALVSVQKSHHAALTSPKEVGALMRVLDGLPDDYLFGLAIRLAPRVFVRPGELRKAEWSELDLKARVWKIPGAKMKMRDAHIVPLSTQAVALFQLAKARKVGRYVFPMTGDASRPMSDMTLNSILRRVGYDSEQQTAHGFRATARTMLDEQLRYPPDVIEIQLAHQVRGPLGDTYNRAKYLETRTEMMQAWSTYLDTLKAQV